MKGEITHELTTPFEYHGNGENKTASVIILSAPSNKQRKHAAKLKQYFFQAINSLQGADKAEAEENAKDPKGSDIVALLMMSDVDANDIHEAFKGIITGGCAMVEGATSLTDSLYEKLSFEDTEEMLGDYLVNFLIPSF